MAPADRPPPRKGPALTSGDLSRLRGGRSQPLGPLRIRGTGADFRTIALVGLFVLAAFYTLFAAQAFFLPLVLATALSLVLRAPVRRLVRLGLPEALAAALVLSSLLGLVGYGAVRLQEPAREWFADVPRTLQQIERKVREIRKPVEEVSRAAEEVQKITEMEQDDGTSKVEIQEPKSFLGGAGVVLAGAFVTIVLVYLFLVFGDDLLTRLIQMLPTAESSGAAKTIALQLEQHISGYLATISLINIGLGMLVGFAMLLLGMPNPWLWGAMAGLFNFIPYLGAMVSAGVIGLVALVTFPEVGRALLAPAIFLVLTSIEGMLVTPIVVGRRFTLNPLVVFTWFFLWGWMWGIGGALLAIPLLTALRILCDHVEPLQPLGELLGREPAGAQPPAADEENEAAGAAATRSGGDEAEPPAGGAKATRKPGA